MIKQVKKLSSVYNRIPTSGKFKSDSAWNMASFVFIGLSGFFLNTLVAKSYPADVLGLFNLAFALFLILAHFVGAGVHFSVLKEIPAAENEKQTTRIIQSAIVASLINSLTVTPIFILGRRLFSPLFDNPADTDILLLIAPGLIFFTLNKTLLAFHNGLRNMRVFAFFSGLRSFFWLMFFVLIYHMTSDGTKVALLFSLSEVSLTILLFGFSAKYIIKKSQINGLSEIKDHLVHGYKSIVGSVFIDANARISIIALGIFQPDSIVGIFSFANVFFDGYKQFANVLRTNVNPLLTQVKAQKGKDELEKFIKKGRNLTYTLLVPIGFLLLVGYPLVLYVLGLQDHYAQSILPMAILVISTMIGVGYGPYLMLFNQTGFPGVQSVLYIFIFAINLVLTFLLVPPLGMNGAAIAAGVAYIAMMLCIKFLGKRYLDIRI